MCIIMIMMVVICNKRASACAGTRRSYNLFMTLTLDPYRHLKRMCVVYCSIYYLSVR